MNLAPIDDARVGELVRNLETVRVQIAAAATAAGRSSDDVTLVAVTKTWPVSDIKILANLGVAEFAENKAQELAGKAGQCVEDELDWHFVGQLQRNKVKQVVPLVRSIESVDRPELVTAIRSSVHQLGSHPLTCLVQVNLDPEPVDGRAGVTPAGALALADQIAACEELVLGGVMGVAPRGGDARGAFDLLRGVSEKITDRHRSATVISAGMSGDFVTAIAAGATHVRLGSALLGERAGFVR